MNESFDFAKDAQKFFKDKIHSLSNAIAHENDSNKIAKLKLQLVYAEEDWKKYSELYKKMNQQIMEKQVQNSSKNDVQYCKTHFWLL